MAVAKKTAKARTPRKRKPKAPPKPSWWKRLWRYIKKPVLISVATLTFVFVCYLGYLDYTVRKQFAGRRWAIPARVYASPVEIYAGLPMSVGQFSGLLQDLHYRPDRNVSSQATYDKKARHITLKTREFTFWDKTEPVHYIRVAFSDKGIRKITDLQTHRELAVVRLEPVQIGSFYPAHKEDRVLVKLEAVPKTLIQGLLATEDRDFYQHIGISFKGIARAMWVNLKAGGFVQGGSTITQQLVKNFYLSSERSLQRKINEALMALILELRFSKEAILEAYLNEVYLGQDGAHAIHGFGLASEFYFSRPLHELPLHQVTALVALIRGPSYYDLRRKPERALRRRNLVLAEMLAQGYISELDAQQATKKPINAVPFVHRPANRYPAFIDLIRRQLSVEYDEADLTSEGLSIFTTLDTQVQDALNSSIVQQLAKIEQRKNAKKLEVAAVVTRRDTGEIVALAGGRDNQRSGFNRALRALRPIGSLIKPIVYLTALEYPDKYTFITPISDTRIRIKAEKGKVWQPSNYDHKEHGDVPLHTALAHSYNLATVRMGMDIGVGRIAKTLRATGVTRPINLYPSMLLGALPMTPFEVTQMYQTLAGDGFAMPLRAISAVMDERGQILQRYPYALKQELDPAATYLTNRILQEVMRDGTGRSAYWQLPKSLHVAGKTGTTNGLKDSWFAGYSGDYLAVVWLGRDDNKSTGVTGASGALRIWSRLMQKVAKQPVYLSMPDTVQNVWIDAETGLKANELCAGAVRYPFVRGSEPAKDAPCVSSTVNKAKTWLNDFIEETF